MSVSVRGVIVQGKPWTFILEAVCSQAVPARPEGIRTRVLQNRSIYIFVRVCCVRYVWFLLCYAVKD